MRSLAPNETARRLAVDDQGRDAAGTIATGAHHRDQEISTTGAGNELLLAVQHIVIAVAHGAGAKRRRVRASAGLGQAVARNQLHGAELWQPCVALGVAAVGIDHPGRHIVDRDESRGGRTARRQRLKNQRRVEPRHGGAADILADVDAAHPERGGLAHDLDGKMFLLVPA
ncbi:hypothetical protein ACVWWP_005472 [Bradyrhizobium sp. LM3.6]